LDSRTIWRFLAKIKQITLNPMNTKKEIPNGISPPDVSSSSIVELIVTVTEFEIKFPISSVKVMLYIYTPGAKQSGMLYTTGVLLAQGVDETTIPVPFSSSV